MHKVGEITLSNIKEKQVDQILESILNQGYYVIEEDIEEDVADGCKTWIIAI